MRKYMLFISTFLFHTIISNSKSSNLIKETLEGTEEKIESVQTVDLTKKPKLSDDTIKYLKKVEIHSATWYNMHGSMTASGIRFHKDSLTAAYNYSKLGSYLRVTNLSGDQSVIVKVTDRMGYKGKYHIDLSKAAFDSIGNPKSGRIKVIIEEIIK